MSEKARFDSLDAIIREMTFGQRVVAVFGNMERACWAFGEVRRKCAERGIPCEARKRGTKLRIKSGDGLIDFLPEGSRQQGRGLACDVFYRDETARIRDWMGPHIMMATQLFGVDMT